MANQVDKLNGIEIAKIEKINGLTDAQVQALNGLEFTGSTDAQLITFATQEADGTAIDSGTGFNTDRSEGISLAFDPDTDQVIIAFSDGSDSTRCKIRIGTISGTTVTFGDKIVTDTSHTGVTATGCHYDQINDRLIVIQNDPYSTYTGTGGIYATAFELDPSANRTVDTQGTTTEVFTSGSGQAVSNNNVSEIQDHDGVVDVLYEDRTGSPDDNHVKTVRIDNASTCSLTVSSSQEFAQDNSNYFGIAYSPDEDKNFIIYVEGNTLKGRTITHFSGSPSLGSEASYNLLNVVLDASEPRGGSTMIYDTEHNEFHFIYRYSGSSMGNVVNDNYYIGNASISGTTVTFGNTGNPGTLMNNTVEIDDLKYGSHHSSNQSGAGLMYSHQRQRIIMHGNSSNSETGSTKKFHVIDWNGSSYTKSSSPIDIFTASGAPWYCHTIRTDNASGVLGTVNLIGYFIYGGSNDGKTFIQGIDAGDSAIS